MNQVGVNTGIHQLPSDCYPPTDSDDDSFVVLKVDPESLDEDDYNPPNILPSNVIEESLEMATDVLSNSRETIPIPPQLEQISTNIITTSITSLTSNLSNDEIHKKVELLIEENNKLKEILHQNNLAMKNQYKVLTMWQQDVEKVQESHKRKFMETKAYIKELQQENAKLNGMLKQNSNSISYLHVDIPEKRILELEETINVLKLDNQKLIGDMTNEIDKLTAKNIEQQQKIENLKLQNESAVADVTNKNEELNTKNKEQQEVINKLKLEIHKLFEDVTNEKDKFFSKNIEHQQEIENLKKKNNDVEHSFDLKEQRYLEEITSLKVAIEQMKAKEINPEEMDNLKQQLRAAQAYITEVKQAKKTIEVEAEANRKKVDELNDKICKLTIESDRNLALEEQLNVYKQDFQEERALKENLLTDKNKIAEDLHNIQRRNQELLDEVERLRSISTFVEVNPTETQNPSAPEPNSSSPTRSAYNCFLCGRNLRSFIELQDHVNYCLVNNS